MHKAQWLWKRDKQGKLATRPRAIAPWSCGNYSRTVARRVDSIPIRIQWSTVTRPSNHASLEHSTRFGVASLHALYESEIKGLIRSHKRLTVKNISAQYKIRISLKLRFEMFFFKKNISSQLNWLHKFTTCVRILHLISSILTFTH